MEAGGDRVLRHERNAGDAPSTYPLAVLFGVYALVAVAFAAVYFRMTIPWSDAKLAEYTEMTHLRPGLLPIFRLRVLVPYLALAVERLTHIDYRLIYRGLAAVSVFGSLLAYRRYLICFMKPAHAGILALGIIYSLLWNLCLLNNLYFPFDLPSLFFFILGLDAIYRRRWRLFYAALILGLLNRETAGFLIVVFAFSLYREMPLRRLVGHVVVQALIALGLKMGISAALDVRVDWLESSHIAHNAGVIRDMITLRGNALKDWAKLVLAFGGLWLVLPIVWKRQPAFIRRSVLVMLPFIAAMLARAVVDEMRDYIELIPVVLTPVAYWVSLRVSGKSKTRIPSGG